MHRRIPLGLAAAIALYIALRAAILWTSFESVALPMYELFPMGTVAELRLRGVEFPLRLVYDNAAGQILMSLLTVPVFAVLGSSYLALKVLPALLGLGVLVLVWLFLARHFSRRAAAIGALAFAIAPPTLVKYSLINSGNHFENLFFVMLALALAYAWHASARKTSRDLALYAFACGLAVFVFLGAIVPIGILAGMHLGLRGLRRSLRDARVALPSFALGIAPLVVVNLATSARGVEFLGAKFAGRTSGRGARVLERMGDFLGPHLFRSPVFEPFAGVSRTAWSVMFLAAFAAAWLACVPSTLASVVEFARRFLAREHDLVDDARAFERAKLVPFALYLPLAALAYGISNFRLSGHAPPVEVAGYRYYLPALLFGLLAIAAWSDRWLRERQLAGVALLACGALPGLSSLAIVDWSGGSRGVAAKLDGFNVAQVGRALVSGKNALSDAEIVALVERFPPEVRFEVESSIGFNLGVIERESAQRTPTHPSGEPYFAIDRLLARFPPEFAIPLQRGVGSALRWTDTQVGRDLDATLRAAAWTHPDDWTAKRNPDFPDIVVVERTPGVPEAPFEEVFVGVAAPNVAPLPPWDLAHVFDANERFIDSPDGFVTRGGTSFTYGHGVVCGRAWARGVDSERAWIRAQRPRGKTGWHYDAPIAWARGAGEGFARGERDLDGLAELLALLPAAHETRAFCQGFGRGLHIRFEADAARVAETVCARAVALDLDAVRDGIDRARTGRRDWAGDD